MVKSPRFLRLPAGWVDATHTSTREPEPGGVTDFVFSALPGPCVRTPRSHPVALLHYPSVYQPQPISDAHARAMGDRQGGEPPETMGPIMGAVGGTWGAGP